MFCFASSPVRPYLHAVPVRESPADRAGVHQRWARRPRLVSGLGVGLLYIGQRGVHVRVGRHRRGCSTSAHTSTSVVMPFLFVVAVVAAAELITVVVIAAKKGATTTSGLVLLLLSPPTVGSSVGIGEGGARSSTCARCCCGSEGP